MSKKLVLLTTLTIVLTGMFGVAIEVQSVTANRTIYIRADGSIEPSTSNITSADNVTYTFTGNIYDSIVAERDNIVVDGAGYTLQGTGSGKGMDLSSRINVTVKNLKIKSFEVGIYLWKSSNNSVCESEITDNKRGIYLLSSSSNSIIRNKVATNVYHGVYIKYSSNHNIVIGNNITENVYGIKVYYSSNNNSMVGNNIRANTFSGIELIYLKYSNVSKNNITRNGRGVLILTGSSHNILKENIITGSNYSGIGLDGEPHHNLLIGNNIGDNNGDGINIFESSNNQFFMNNIVRNGRNGIGLYSSPNNIFYHNNFVNNTNQVLDYSGNNTPSINLWDNGVEGNYWSDYTSVDMKSGPFQNETGSDGIGDTPYFIDENNQDNYPLMGLFSDFNATSEYHITTICNSTISDFQFNGTAICFNVTGKDGTTGFCRICIPKALMNDTYKVFVNSTEVPHTLLQCSNSTHSYLYFTYTHSTQKVAIKRFVQPPPWNLIAWVCSAILASCSGFFGYLYLKTRRELEKVHRKIAKIRDRKTANICPNCRVQNKPEAKFCRKCGKSL